MSKTKDYIPGTDAELDGWFENLKNRVVEKTGGQSPEWSHIPLEKVTALINFFTAWHAAYEKMLGPHTSVDTEAKNEAKNVAKAFIRVFVAQYLMFDPVTNEDRKAMRLHNRDTTRTPIGKPTSRARITELKPLGGFQLELRFQDETTPGSRAIPYGCNGCLLNYTWGSEKVTDYAALTQTQLMTRSPWVITLPPEAEGKFFSGSIRWQSERAELGPWSDIQSVVIA